MQIGNLSTAALSHHLLTHNCCHNLAILSLGLFTCLLSILVRLGFYNKIPQTRQLINNKILFFIVLEAGSLR